MTDTSEIYIKICSKCNQGKGLKEFYKNKYATDGRRSRCKNCMNIYYRTYRKTEARKKVLRKYLRSEKGKKAHRRDAKIYRTANTLKIIAHNAVGNAVVSGQLKREPCEICGSVLNINGHHENYNKLFDVIWLCSQHHANLHGGL